MNPVKEKFNFLVAVFSDIEIELIKKEFTYTKTRRMTETCNHERITGESDSLPLDCFTA
jgi:hypothetical protein